MPAQYLANGSERWRGSRKRELISVKIEDRWSITTLTSTMPMRRRSEESGKAMATAAGEGNQEARGGGGGRGVCVCVCENTPHRAVG